MAVVDDTKNVDVSADLLCSAERFYTRLDAHGLGSPLLEHWGPVALRFTFSWLARLTSSGQSVHFRRAAAAAAAEVAGALGPVPPRLAPAAGAGDAPPRGRGRHRRHRGGRPAPLRAAPALRPAGGPALRGAAPITSCQQLLRSSLIANSESALPPLPALRRGSMSRRAGSSCRRPICCCRACSCRCVRLAIKPSNLTPFSAPPRDAPQVLRNDRTARAATAALALPPQADGPSPVCADCGCVPPECRGHTHFTIAQALVCPQQCSAVQCAGWRRQSAASWPATQPLH